MTGKGQGRNVIGTLFADYVRMIRANKSIPWRQELPAGDLPFVETRVDAAGWYPMETFERLGNVIFKHVAASDMQAVRVWGQVSTDQLLAANPMLVAAGDPVETVNRFRVLRATYFDFDAMTIPTLIEGEAQIIISYHMGDPAEEAASWQALGFFERLLEIAGAKDVRAKFTGCVWEGDPKTVLSITWS